jgi:hypothetical protein
MNCHDCEELLQRLLDGESLAPSAELDGHLAACSDCKGRIAAAQSLRVGLRMLPAVTPPADFAGRVQRAVLAEQRAHRTRRWAAAALAMAASIALVAFGVHYFTSEDDTQPDPEQHLVVLPQPQPDPKPQPQPDPPKREPGLRESVQQARQALDGLAGKFLEGSREQADVMRDATAPLELARIDMGQKRTPTDPKLARPRTGMAAGLDTVAATTRRGLSFMLKETPPLPAGKRALAP